MASQLKLLWEPSHDPGLPRRDRQGCWYEAYLPDQLVGRRFEFSGPVVADVADAERAVARLNREADALADTEAAARLLLRAEAVASSRIEGLEVGARRLLLAQAARNLGDDEQQDVTAIEVLNNIDAMAWAIDHLSEVPRLERHHVLEIHRRLLRGTRLEADAGVVRREQNWIGGSSFNPCRAEFVPPPHDRVDVLLDDLAAFCNMDDLPPVAQAAVVHAQFETIHPFIDGNGRTGRALVHVLLRRRGLAPKVAPPVSLVLATRAEEYVDGLMATRYLGEPNGRAARDGLDRWVGLFSAATTRAVADAEAYESRIDELQSDWRRRVGGVRKGSATQLIIDALPGAPIVTVKSLAGLIGRTPQAVNTALPRLLDAGVLRQTTAGRRNRMFEAGDLIQALTALERQLASPAGDTRVSDPPRRVPYRAVASSGES